MSEWDQNRTRSYVALKINTGLSLVAIVYLLWLPGSHNMADFHVFLAYFHHLFHTAVTVTIETGTSGVLNLPHTYDKWWGTLFGLSVHLSMAGGGPKMALFMAKIRPKLRGCSRLDRPTWKVSSAPYHTPIHGRAWFRTIFARSRHLSRVPGVQKWLFLWLKSDQNDRAAPG